MLAAAALTITAAAAEAEGALRSSSRSRGGGSLAAIDLSGATFTVGSKEFAEQKILGQIAVQALQASGPRSGPGQHHRHTNVRTALTSGQIDLYWEYTGTGWTTHLQHEPGTAAKNPAQLFQAVKDEDAEEQDQVAGPAPLNDTYAIAAAQRRYQASPP